MLGLDDLERRNVSKFLAGRLCERDVVVEAEEARALEEYFPELSLRAAMFNRPFGLAARPHIKEALEKAGFVRVYHLNGSATRDVVYRSKAHLAYERRAGLASPGQTAEPAPDATRAAPSDAAILHAVVRAHPNGGNSLEAAIRMTIALTRAGFGAQSGAVRVPVEDAVVERMVDAMARRLASDGDHWRLDGGRVVVADAAFFASLSVVRATLPFTPDAPAAATAGAPLAQEPFSDA